MPTKESLIQSAIEQLLSMYESMGRLVYTKNNSGAAAVESNGRRRFFRFGKAGSPDFFVFLPAGGVLHLEVKNEVGKLNKNQIGYQEMITRLGHDYKIVRSVDDVENILKSYN